MEHDDVTHDLANLLDSFDREGAYRVERVLKVADAERTELVRFVAGNGADLGPFVRKRIDLASGCGFAYEIIWHAQQQGARFVHLPRIIECRRVGTELTAVVEYVAGDTLETMVVREGASPALAERVLPSLCDAVAEVHENFAPPLIHRDLKPSNIVMAGDTPVIIDFGIARSYREGAQADTVRFGTRGYAAPEQFGFGQTSVRSDIYALGMLLFYCCTGVQPTGLLDAGILERLDVPPHLSRVMLKAAAFDPMARYAGARELKADLVKASKVVSGAGGGVSAPEREPEMGAQTKAALPPGGYRVDREWPQGVRGSSALLDRMVAQLAAIFGRVPAWVGVIWNIAVLCAYALVIAGSVLAVLEPTGENVRYPIWFLVLEYFFMLLPGFGAIAYLLLDRRRLRERISWLHGVTWRRELRVCLAIMVIPLIITMIVAQFVE